MTALSPTKTRSPTRRAALFAVVAAAYLTTLVASCGGGSTVVIGGRPGPEISGQVSMPNGEVAAVRSWLMRLAHVVVARVEALIADNVEPVGAGVEVRLVRINDGDILDGQIRGGQLIARVKTGDDGRYNVRLPSGQSPDTCRFYVEVGSSADRTLTRAFVFAQATDISFQSEATVRLLLEQIQAGATTLCDLSSADIKLVYDAVVNSQRQVFGDSAAAINSSAVAVAAGDPSVQAAIQAAVGAPTPAPTATNTSAPAPPTATRTAGRPTATGGAAATRTASTAPTRTAGGVATRTATPEPTGTAGPPTRTATPETPSTSTATPSLTAEPSNTAAPTNTAEPTATTGSLTPSPTSTTAPTTAAPTNTASAIVATATATGSAAATITTTSTPTRTAMAATATATGTTAATVTTTPTATATALVATATATGTAAATLTSTATATATASATGTATGTSAALIIQQPTPTHTPLPTVAVLGSSATGSSPASSANGGGQEGVAVPFAARPRESSRGWHLAGTGHALNRSARAAVSRYASATLII